MKYDEIRHAWNAQADDGKHWNCLTEAEKIEWAASIAATRPTQPAAQGLDAETQRHAAIGKAIERAVMDLPDGTEIVVSLEKDAGTVTLIDQDGNEYENFSCDYGFAGVLNEAIDAAMAAHARNKKGIEQ